MVLTITVILNSTFSTESIRSCNYFLDISMTYARVKILPNFSNYLALVTDSYVKHFNKEMRQSHSDMIHSIGKPMHLFLLHLI